MEKKRVRRTKAEIAAGITKFEKRTGVTLTNKKPAPIEDKEQVDMSVEDTEPSPNKLVGDNITRIIKDILQNTRYENERVSLSDMSLTIMNDLGAKGYKYCFDLNNYFYFQRAYNIEKRKKQKRK